MLLHAGQIGNKVVDLARLILDGIMLSLCLFSIFFHPPSALSMLSGEDLKSAMCTSCAWAGKL